MLGDILARTHVGRCRTLIFSLSFKRNRSCICFSGFWSVHSLIARLLILDTRDNFFQVFTYVVFTTVMAIWSFSQELVCRCIVQIYRTEFLNSKLLSRLLTLSRCFTALWSGDIFSILLGVQVYN